MPRRESSTGIAAAQRRRQLADKVPEVPEGLELPTELHQILWRQFSQGRLVSDWLQADLVQLHEVVRLEIEIRRIESDLETLGEAGRYQETASGLLKEHPRVMLLYKARNAKLSLLRALGLTVPTTGNAKTRYRTNAPTDEDRKAAENIKSKPSLLAVT